ncbi:MAG: exo-alpha-sialidase, partial [Verrucomicrobiae bacterium]|nr:exo-alpha-sialidase [Verrucomicrobiae bacterium]
MKRILPVLGLFLGMANAVLAENSSDPFDIELTVARQGFEGTFCWVHARAGAIPAGMPGNSGSAPLVVMTLQQLQLSGSDVFYALNDMRSSDLGNTWS